MRSNSQITWKKASSTVVLLLALSLFWAQSAQAQSEDEQKLKDEVQQLKQETQELKARIAAIEKTSAATSQPVVTTVEVVPGPNEATEKVTVEATTPEKRPSMDLYGFAMLDSGYDFGQNDPAWFDVMRPTKLPAFANQFGGDGHFYIGSSPVSLRREDKFPHVPRRGENNLRIRAVRDRRGCRSDHFPFASRLGRTGAIRCRPDLEPIHGS